MDRKDMLAKRLRDLRAAAQLTQGQVADLFRPKVSRAAVAQWESAENATIPDLFRLGVLARAYNTTIDFIVTGQHPTEQLAALAPEAKSIAEALAQLPPDQARYHRDAILRDVEVQRALPQLAARKRSRH